MNMRKRGYALLFCIGFVLMLLVSSAFLIREADHDCCGEHCPVCEMIAMTTALMRSFCLIAAALLLRSVFAAARSAFHAPETGYGHSAGTPVSRKIRMND